MKSTPFSQSRFRILNESVAVDEIDAAPGHARRDPERLVIGRVGVVCALQRRPRGDDAPAKAGRPRVAIDESVDPDRRVVIEDRGDAERLGPILDRNFRAQLVKI